MARLRPWLLTVVAAGMLVPAVSAAVRVGVRPAVVSRGAEQSWVDPTGDSGLAPDITRISVANTSSEVTFNIQTPNYPTKVSSGPAAWEIHIDADQNRATGYKKDGWGNNGYEYNVLLWLGKAQLLGCSAGGCTGALLSTSAYSNGIWTVSIPRSLFTRTKFDFYVQTSYEGTHKDYDWAGTPTYNTYALTGAPTTTTTRGKTIVLNLFPATTIGSKTQAPDTKKSAGTKSATKRCTGTPRFDYNHNGCPGPYPRIEARLPGADYTSAGRTGFGDFVIRALPRGSTVRVSVGGRSETILTGTGTSAHSTLISNQTFAAGTIVVIDVTRPGWIGYYARAKVVTHAPGMTVVTRLCVPATGGRPAPCSRVPRGR